MVSFPWVILTIAFAAASIIWLVGDEIITPTETIYSSSSTIYSKTNTYATIINQWWALLPIGLIIAAIIYSQAQAQKRGF